VVFFTVPYVFIDHPTENEIAFPYQIWRQSVTLYVKTSRFDARRSLGELSLIEIGGNVS